MGKALEWFGGSVLIYAVVAACGGVDATGTRIPRPMTDAGAGGVMGAGGTVQDSGLADVVADALDAMVSPVPDADAQVNPPGPTILTDVCDEEYQTPSTLHFAQVASVVPVDRLARAVAYEAIPSDTPENQISYLPTGFREHRILPVAIRSDGIAAYGCFASNTVTFVIPL